MTKELLEQIDALERFKQYKKSGMTEREIAKTMGYTWTDRKGNVYPSTAILRAKMTIVRNYIRQKYGEFIVDLKKDGLSNLEIANKLGVTESHIRSALSD